ncbi:hypothetical protein Syn7803C60_158 [Synechococcus phage ACG-2014a]|nr:hypothetical protein Syn7803C60_158 [Synechococcus phage ACG-2014a]
MSSYDKNRKRAAQRAADRNAARAAGKTGVVPGVGYVTARKEKETYTDEKGTVRHKSGAKNEAFAFSEADFAELETLGEEIDSLTDEQLIDVMEDIILEMAQDDQDLIEICEHLEGVEMLSEEKTKQLELKLEPSRMDRLKGAAKKAGEKVGAAAKAAGSAAKKGIKAAGKSVSKNAGKAVGEFQAARIKAKRASMEKTPAKSKSSDDGTDGKLDSVLSSIRKSKGTSSSSSSSSDSGSSSSGGGESSSSSSSAPAKKPGLLRRAAGAIGRGLKKAVGKTARAVSGGSDKLAKRLGEDYDKIAHLYESGLFSLEEIETVIEEGYKELPKNKMFRKAGNLGRDVVSPSVTDDQRQKAYGRSKKIIKVMNKETQKQERGEK